MGLKIERDNKKIRMIIKDLDMLPYALSSVGVSIVIIWVTGIWSE